MVKQQMLLSVDPISTSQVLMDYYNGGILAAYWQVGKGMTKVSKVKTYGRPQNSVHSSRASSIFVSGSKVYMAGAVNVINVGDVPVYWKGKTQHELPVEFNLKDL